MKKVEIAIKGMHCGSCEKLVKMELEELEGVAEVQASSAQGLATAEVAEGVDYKSIEDVVASLGYEVEGIKEI